ncbi:MAG TPA: DUF1902 domain-containing protein [Stellaceae bacterium]|nr:DUF1902 domain-containing protein [Stellaceae bacterium]
MKRFEAVAAWDPEGKVWWCTNDELPFTTEAPSFSELEVRAGEIGQEMAEINGLVAPGERVEIRVVKEPEPRAP